METKYYKQVGILIAALVMLLLGGLVLIFNTGPRVRFVQLSDAVKNHTMQQGNNFAFRFDRPIKPLDYSKSIHIEPETAFSTQTYDQAIVVTLENNLLSDTEYTISLSPDVIDTSNKKMHQMYTYSFKTNKASFIFVQRNYGHEAHSGLDRDDHIVRVTASGEEEVIFSQPEIRSVRANMHKIIAVVKNDTYDDMYIIDRKTYKAERVVIPNKTFIHNIVVPARGNIAAYIMQPDHTSVTQPYYKQFENLVTVVNLEDNSVDYIDDGNNQILRGYNLQSDMDGQVVFVQDKEQQYFATSPYNDYSPILIGTYSGIHSYNQSSTELLVRAGPDFYSYNADKGGRIKRSVPIPGFIQTISKRYEGIYISSIEYKADIPQSRLWRMNSWENEPTVIWHNQDTEDTVLESFIESPDNRSLLLQINPITCTYDQIGFNTACHEVKTLLIKDDTVREFKGFNAQWLP